jgi:hypothetical protein
LKAENEWMSKDPLFREKIVNPIVDYISEHPEIEIWYNLVEYVKYLDKNNEKHTILAKRIQVFLINEIKNWREFIRNTFLISFSIKSWFDLDKDKVNAEFKNLDEAIKKLWVEETVNWKWDVINNSNIWYFAHFLSILKEYLTNQEQVKKIDEVTEWLYKVHYEMSSIWSLEDFKSKLNNSWLLERKLTPEELKKLDYKTIWGFMQSIKPYLKDKNINENNFWELLNIFEQINRAKKEEAINWLPVETKDILEKWKILRKKEDWKYSIDDVFLKWIISEYSQKSKENKWETLNSIITKKLKENWIEANEEIISFIEKQVEIEKSEQEIIKIKNNKELRENYILFANWEISQEEFEKQKIIIENKESTSNKENWTQNIIFDNIEFSQTNSWYEIPIWKWENLELSYSEFEKLKDNKKNLLSVIDFYKELKSLWIDFVWNYREFFTKEIKNFNINDGLNEQELLDLYNFIWKQIWKEWKTLDNAKKEFWDLNRWIDINCSIKWEDLIPPESKLESLNNWVLNNYLTKNWYFDRWQLIEWKWIK